MSKGTTDTNVATNELIEYAKENGWYWDDNEHHFKKDCHFVGFDDWTETMKLVNMQRLCLDRQEYAQKYCSEMKEKMFWELRDHEDGGKDIACLADEILRKLNNKLKGKI